MSTTTKTIARSMADGSYIEATVEELDDSGQLSPGFSVTGSIWEKHGNISGAARKRNGREQDTGGCVHDEILAAFPHLAPLVHVHLADQSGLPLHAKANGWYFYSGGCSEYERKSIAAGKNYGYSRNLETSDHDRAARALHVPPADLPAGLDHEGFDAFVDSLTERYVADAAAARAVLASLTNGAGVVAA